MTNPADGKLHRFDVMAAVSYVASGGLAAASLGLSQILPHYTTTILGVSAIAVGVAGMILRLFSNPSPPTGTVSVVAPKNPTPPATPEGTTTS